AMRPRQIRRDVIIGHLGCDADGMSRGIERADRPDAAAALDTRIPESFLADAVGGYHAQATDNHSAHRHPPPGPLSLPRTVVRGHPGPDGLPGRTRGDQSIDFEKEREKLSRHPL